MDCIFNYILDLFWIIFFTFNDSILWQWIIFCIIFWIISWIIFVYFDYMHYMFLIISKSHFLLILWVAYLIYVLDTKTQNKAPYAMRL